MRSFILYDPLILIILLKAHFVNSKSDNDPISVIIRVLTKCKWISCKSAVKFSIRSLTADNLFLTLSVVKVTVEFQHHIYPAILIVEHLDLFQQHPQVSVRHITA